MPTSDGNSRGLPRTVASDPVHWIAFGFGTGLLPFAPGTWASLVTAIVYWWAAPVGAVVLGTLVVLLLTVGTWICGESSRRLGVHDHGGIVLDEVAGMLLTLLVVPPDPTWILAAFAAFRVADIWKPWPIREVDHRLSGGPGIMLDDVLAAFYAALALVVLQRLLP